MPYSDTTLPGTASCSRNACARSALRNHRLVLQTSVWPRAHAMRATPSHITSASVPGASDIAASIPPAGVKMVFEPQVDPTVAGTQLGVLALSIGLAAYW